jgi:hypothetical protein
VIVQRIHTEIGSHVEPQLDQDWPEWKKLEWLAAVVSVDTSIPIRIAEATFSTKRRGKWRVDPDAYSINYGHGAIGAYGYQEAWSLLTGIGLGVDLARTKDKP